MINFYFFSSDFEVIDKLESAGFAGALFIYNASSEDPFTKISRKMVKDSKFKYMVAVRPYVISPQYLSMINKSFESISSSRLQLNLISGHIKPNEKNIGGIIGDVNDSSTSIERSDYLIKYLDSLHSMKARFPDFYVSVTNSFTFDAAKRHGDKVIIPYSQYINNTYDLSGMHTMISVTPRLRKTQEDIDALKRNSVQHKSDMADFSYDAFYDIVKQAEEQGIKEIILSSWEMVDTEHIIEFVKEYKEREKAKA